MNVGKCGCLLMFLVLVFPKLVQGETLYSDGTKVSYSEFKRVCERDSIFFPTDRNNSGSRFLDFDLMVGAVRLAGIDTLPDIREQVENYRRKLLRSYLLDRQAVEKTIKTTYNRMKIGYGAGRVQVSHIFKYLPQNASVQMLQAAEMRMDSIYRSVQNGASFEECVEIFSDEKQSFWVKRLQMPEEFEDIVFRMQPGQVSEPFFTPQGIHIVKVLVREEIPSFSVMKDSLMEKEMERNQVNEEMASVVDQLKEEFGYESDRIAVEELYRNGHTDRILFTLAGRPYTGADFNVFAMAHPAVISRQFEEFVAKSLFDLENDNLGQKHPKLDEKLQAYQDSLLVGEICRREIYEKNICDDARLKAYFETHRANYDWEEPRYKGLIVHAVTKRMAKRVRKFLKKLPEKEWNDAVRLVFNVDGKSQVSIEYGTFSPGENIFVDDLVFKRAKAIPLQDYPFTVVTGKKIKGPEGYQEIRDRLIADYYRDARLRWLNGLRVVSKVEINQEVLKTVNNH